MKLKDRKAYFLANNNKLEYPDATCDECGNGWDSVALMTMGDPLDPFWLCVECHIRIGMVEQVRLLTSIVRDLSKKVLL